MVDEPNNQDTFADKVGRDEFMHIVDDFFAHDYQDRGMRKWQGYFLSDHTAALKRQAEDLAVDYPPLPKQDTGVVRELLGGALANGNSVSIQLDEVDPEGKMYPPTEGKLRTLTDNDEVMIGEQFIAISAIRHVEVIPFPVQ